MRFKLCFWVQSQMTYCCTLLNENIHFETYGWKTNWCSVKTKKTAFARSRFSVNCSIILEFVIVYKREDRMGSKTPISMTTWFIVLILVNTSSGNTVPLYRSANNCLNYQFASIIYRPTEAALIKMLKNDLGLVLASTTSCFLLGCAFNVWAWIEAPHVNTCVHCNNRNLNKMFNYFKIYFWL